MQWVWWYYIILQYVVIVVALSRARWFGVASERFFLYSQVTSRSESQSHNDRFQKVIERWE